MRGTQFINDFVPSCSIPISVKSLPAGTKSLAIVMTDPDGGNWVHWLAANVSVKGLKDNASIKAPSGMVQGINDFGTIGYGGPTPPSGVHNYVITVYALSDKISLESGFTLSQLTNSINGLILGQCTITGSYAA
jgi:Raf kinase inhibitor-like YbhB/YbcL family protein